MMCSIEELGSDRNMYPEAPEYGIYIFPEDAPVGASAVPNWVLTMWFFRMKLPPTGWTVTV